MPTNPADALAETARSLMADDKGLLAMDESTGTANKRFAALGIPQDEPTRRAYREWIVTAPGLGRSISGAILFDETIRQSLSDGTPFARALERAGIVPGIKVDAGAVALPGFDGEKITEGLDGLAARFAEYAAMGARFAKWRAVIAIGDGIPSQACIDANAHALARYAAIAQAVGIVPIVEPEVLMDGDHDLERCAEVTERVLRRTFAELAMFRVRLEATLLKPNMVLSGADCARQASVEDVADATVRVLRRTVPAACAGVAFLSGGQSAELASARLNAMQVRHGASLPWPLTFSFSRAIQQPALDLWKGKPENVEAARRALVHRADLNRAARRGEYRAELEH